MAHDLDTNAASKTACIGSIRQQFNSGCGNSQENRWSLMPRGCAPAEGIPTHLQREPDLDALHAAKGGDLDWILGETR